MSRSIGTGIIAFIVVLLLMPLGHTLMILMEKLFSKPLVAAGIVGTVGFILLIVSIRIQEKKTLSSLGGLLAGILVWTGWIEFSFVWIADKYAVPDLMENGEVVTNSEYLIMPSSIGLLASFIILYLTSPNRCQFFNFFQGTFGLKKQIKKRDTGTRSPAVVIFIESIMIIWTFYIVLLLAYDTEFAGDRHWFTYLVAYGSLFWSLYLIGQLLKIKKFDYAVRYAIPTVVIFWNFVEVLGRWDLFKEIWVHPFEHWVECLVIFLIFAGVVVYSVIEFKRNQKTIS